MPTLFTRIVDGEIPCYKVAETADYLAFLDIRPSAVGHTLCIPKKEVNYIFDVEDDLLAGLMLFAKRVAKAIEKEVPCLRCGVAVVGLEVPHAHIHLIPLNSMADFSFKNKVEMEPDAMAALATRIAAHL
jgi:histidine triad (HIT) family protein